MKHILAISLAPLALATMATAAAGQTYFHGCGNQNLIEPTEIVLTCADAKLRVEDLDWTTWDTNSRWRTAISYTRTARRGSPSTGASATRTIG